MVEDKNKGILVDYNLLNLPEKITFDLNHYIEYLYTADGRKLSKIVTENTTISYTDYLGERVDCNRAEVDYLLHDLGRVVAADAGKWIYEYHLTDHLGNVRVAFADLDEDGDAEMLQENHYYPFGQRLNLPGYQSSDANPYLYNGKELQEDMGLRWYDYGRRMYDPALGRFHVQDRFTEKYLDFSLYHYGANNPILFIDVNGDSLYVANNENTYNDIKSLAKDKNQQYISFNEDGSVTLDFSGVDAKTQKKAMRDKGLKLIGNLVESQDADGNTENYYYEASNTREGVMPAGSEFSISLDSKAGTETGLNDNSFATNLSTTDHGVPGVSEVKPANGYDGAVYISPGTMYNRGADGVERAVPRSSLVRHELSENYNRTHKKMNYNQAHQSAGGVGTYTRFKYAPLKK